jgi:hypothetical protein
LTYQAALRSALLQRQGFTDAAKQCVPSIHLHVQHFKLCSCSEVLPFRKSQDNLEICMQPLDQKKLLTLFIVLTAITVIKI